MPKFQKYFPQIFVVITILVLVFMGLAFNDIVFQKHAAKAQSAKIVQVVKKKPKEKQEFKKHSIKKSVHDNKVNENTASSKKPVDIKKREESLPKKHISKHVESKSEPKYSSTVITEKIVQTKPQQETLDSEDVVSKNNDEQTRVTITPSYDINESIVLSKYFNLINKFRADHGFDDLELIQGLMHAADIRAETEAKTVIDSGDITLANHYLNNGQEFRNDPSLVIFGSGHYGELLSIITIGDSDDKNAELFFDDLKSNSKYLSEMLSTYYTKTGISITKISDTQYLLIQELFGD